MAITNPLAGTIGIMTGILTMNTIPVTTTETGCHIGTVTTTRQPQAGSTTVITKTQTTHQLLPLTGQTG